MFSNYLIGLREGLEASLVVCILIAYLVKTDRRDALKPIWIGIGVAVALALGFGCALEFGSQELTFEAQEALGGSLSIVAVGLVTWMVFWMRRTARHLKAELHGKLDAALAMGTGALVATAFLAVGREGLETALFVWASVHAASDGTPRPLVGVAPGPARPRSSWAGCSTGAPCRSTWRSSSPGPAACWSSWRRACWRTASTTCRRPTGCRA